MANLHFQMPKYNHKVKIVDKIFLVQQLQIMVKAGVPLTGALKTLSLQANGKYLRTILTDIELRVEKGMTLAESMRPNQDDFGHLMVNMIAAGESSGKLEEVLGQIYIQMTKDHEIVSRVRSALVYPAIVVTAMVVIGTGMMIFVIPTLTQLFKDSHVDLPLPTKILIAISDFVNAYVVFLIPGVVLVAAAFGWAIRRSPGRQIWHQALLIMPVIGPITKKINVARFARTVSSFLKTDIPIVQTLVTTASVLSNVHYQNALIESSRRITKGITLGEALKSWPKLFNPTILQMITVGEQSGALDDILIEAANFYEAEVSQTMATLPSLLEPILMIILGLAVGSMAVAVILPLYKLTEAF